MPPTELPGSISLGFLTIQVQDAAYVGAYLVTNAWGRPLEFRLSSPVQPNRVQRILYGNTLGPYICSDLIAQTLVEKTQQTPHLIFTDCRSALDLRLHVDIPVVFIDINEDPDPRPAFGSCPIDGTTWKLERHSRFPEDAARALECLGRLDIALSLSEPIWRAREALSEAQRMKVATHG